MSTKYSQRVITMEATYTTPAAVADTSAAPNYTMAEPNSTQTEPNFTPAESNSTMEEPNSAYALFRHIRELKRTSKRSHFIKVSQTKIDLTDQLICKVKQRKKQGTISSEDREILWREKDFRKYLRHRVKRHEKEMRKIQKKVLKMKGLL